MTKTIAIINQKGGVGKTTTTANLAYALANKGYKILAIDFDGQASLTNCLNVGLGEDEVYLSVADVMMDLNEKGFNGFDMDILDKAILTPTYTTRTYEKSSDGKNVAVDSEVPFGYDLLPSHIQLADYEMMMSQSVSSVKGYQLLWVITKIVENHQYDYILIDCPPALSILSVNAITAAQDGILIPTNLDLMSTRGVELLIEKIAEIQETIQNAQNGNLTHYGIIGIILNMFSTIRVIDRNIASNLEKFYPLITFDAHIPESSKAKSAASAGRLYSQLYDKADKAFNKLGSLLVKRLKEMEKEGPKIVHLESKGKMMGGDI